VHFVEISTKGGFFLHLPSKFKEGNFLHVKLAAFLTTVVIFVKELGNFQINSQIKTRI
jgi:hypothetical protein